MYKVTFEKTIQPGRPTSYHVFSKKEIREFWVSNISIAMAARKNGSNIICYTIEDELMAIQVTATLMRELLEDRTNCITYLPESGLLFVDFGSVLNWVDGVRDKINLVVKRVIRDSRALFSKVRDKWGEALIDLSNQESVMMGRME